MVETKKKNIENQHLKAGSGLLTDIVAGRKSMMDGFPAHFRDERVPTIWQLSDWG